MKKLVLSLMFASVAGTALAQHEGHVTPAPAATEADPHAGHTMPEPAESAAAADPHAGHVMPAPAESAAAADPHAGHTMPAPAAAARDQPPAPEAFAGPLHAADLIYGAAEMAAARDELRSEHGGYRSLFVMADQFEWRKQDGDESYVWDAQAWYGGDIDRFWFKTEGEAGADTGPDEIEVQTLWSHAIHPWFDVQAGARWDFESGYERSHLVLGVQGLAPYNFEIDAAAFISDEGDVSARFEGEYDAWLTQRLVLQPRVEFELALQDVASRGLGSGLSSADFGARLHYQLAREVAPYLGVEYERLFGGTADAARSNGDETEGWRFVLGMRTWF